MEKVGLSSTVRIHWRWERAACRWWSEIESLLAVSSVSDFKIHVLEECGVAFVYGDSMQNKARDKREGLLSHADPSYMFNNKENAVDNISTNTNTVAITGEGDKIGATDL